MGEVYLNGVTNGGLYGGEGDGEEDSIQPRNGEFFCFIHVLG